MLPTKTLPGLHLSEPMTEIQPALKRRAFRLVTPCGLLCARVAGWRGDDEADGEPESNRQHDPRAHEPLPPPARDTEVARLITATSRSSPSRRDREREGRANPYLTLHPDSAPMQLD